MEAARENGEEEVFRVKKSEPVLVHPAEEREMELYFLSNLDQNIAVIMETIHFFKAADAGETANVCRAMRGALSKLLVQFYPLAGKLAVGREGKLVVECTGEGVQFVEAVAEHEMDMFYGKMMPRPEILGRLVHTIAGAETVLEAPLVTFQVTRFRCGGFVVGMAMNHCMADGISAAEFLVSWGEATRGLSLSLPPSLDRSLLTSRQPPRIEFRHREFEEIDDISDTHRLYRDQPTQYRSFRFDAEKLLRLRKAATADGRLPNCTTFSLLAAFVWRARAAALNLAPAQATKLLFAADGRSRLDPPLPRGFFGNAIVLTYCLTTAEELTQNPFSSAVKMVQEATRIVTREYIRSAIDYIELRRGRPSLSATLVLTSWVGLGFGSVDFGVGRWVRTWPGALPEKEVALFLPHESRRGSIEVVLGLPASCMKAFEEMTQF